MDKRIVQESDNQAGFAGHRCMHGVACVEITQDRIGRVGGAASNQVAWVEVPHDDLNVGLLKISLDFFAEKQADVFQLDVAGLIAVPCRILEQLLACAFGHRNDSVGPFLKALL